MVHTAHIWILFELTRILYNYGQRISIFEKKNELFLGAV